MTSSLMIVLSQSELVGFSLTVWW